MTESGGASIEVVIAAPAPEVWAALRDPQLIRRWHGWEDDGLDAEIEQIYGAAATVEESGTRLVLAGGDTVDLATVPGGTRLRLRRAPLGSQSGVGCLLRRHHRGLDEFPAAVAVRPGTSPG